MKEAKEEELKRDVEKWQNLLKPVYVLLRFIAAVLRNAYKAKKDPAVKAEDIMKFPWDKKTSKGKPLSAEELKKDKERLKKKHGNRKDKNRSNAR